MSSSDIRRIAVNTGGGDAPGLNAVIRAVVLAGLKRGWEVLGIRRGYHGLYEPDGSGLVAMDRDSVRGITHHGGTILGTANRGSPFAYPVEQPDGTFIEEDRSAHVLRAFEEHKIDALVAIGGDGSLTIAHQLSCLGLPVVGVPKTIDNDVEGTFMTFGFLTAVNVATDALGRLHSTAESHNRVMVVEVMGRDSGWIALFSGISGSADVILMPEIPFRMDAVVEKIRQREAAGRNFSIVVVAEGAKPEGDRARTVRSREPGQAEARLGGIGSWVATEIERETGKETRDLVLGHLQRGGQPTAFDRVIALRFGAAAVRAVEMGAFGCMVALQPPNIAAVPLADAIRHRKKVPRDGEVIQTARDLGICLGD